MHWKDILDRLACPACKSPLQLISAPSIPTGSEALRCNACRRTYPVRDDIPILLIDQATIDA